MYKRFLNDSDYLSIVTEEALDQLIRGNHNRLSQAEEAAEASILEYLTEHYSVETALSVGKNIAQHNRQITYPVGSYFYHEGKICEALRTINGYKAPSDILYWTECEEVVDEGSARQYAQTDNYYPGDIAIFACVPYKCMEHNGIDFKNIRIPGIEGWVSIVSYQWQANLEYGLWEVVKWNGSHYALTELSAVDLTENPQDSDNWGMIGTYDPEYPQYMFSDHEYVVFSGDVYVPTMNVNADSLVEGYNFRWNDPRNANIKKHMLRMAVYELYKLISPNNVSSARITDYETSIVWLRDASRLRINPQIKRKLDEENKPITEYAIATFQRDYDPYKNPWQI